MINWKTITENKRKQVARDNIRENKSRIPHEYAVGDTVLKKKGGIKRKYSNHKTPYQITEVHTNGTVTLSKGAKRLKINIRNIEPYKM